MLEIHPKKIAGSWDEGYVLDVHTVSSTMIGFNEFGHPEFDIVRSQLGELVYQLKYKNNKAAIVPIIEAVEAFLKTWGIHPDVIVPIPPSKFRSFQPVFELARALAQSLDIVLNTEALIKMKTTPQMKDIRDFSARVNALEATFASNETLADKTALLLDDLLQSGATLNVAAKILKLQGRVQAVHVLALTRTRN